MSDPDPAAAETALPPDAIPAFRGARMLVPLVLASTSPRRHELLRRLGVPFRAVDPGVDESPDTGGGPEDLVRENSLRKARAVARNHPEAVVLGADTVVAVEDRILGKPVDHAEARAMLRILSGREHTVYTGIALCAEARRLDRFHCTCSRVRFKPMSDRGIAEYIRLVDPLDKAGAYGIQEERERIIAEIHGSFSNVMGLPLESLLRIMEQEGLIDGRV